MNTDNNVSNDNPTS